MSQSAPLKPIVGKPPFFAGIDVGGTNIKIGVVDDEGHPLSRLIIPTEVPNGPDAAVARIGETVRRAIAAARLTQADIARVGLGTPGTMDIPQGLLLAPGNLPGWRQFPIRDRVSQVCGLPVSFVNDAAAAAYGEYWVGRGKMFHSMALFTLGTGVGGGIIIGDLSVDGEHSTGAELGHIIIDYNDDARLCSCGQRGHLEAYASATAVVRRTEEALLASRSSTLSARIAGGETLTPILIGEEADRGDPLAEEIIFDTARYLGVGSVTVMHTIDPSGVLFGGAMTFGQHETPLGQRFLERVRQEIKRRTFPILAERTTIDYASLGGDAGFIGSAGTARLEHLRQKK